MKPTTAANLSLLLMAAGWLLLAYGRLSMMGDPSPGVPEAELIARYRISWILSLTGFFSLISALWLSGFAFSAARWRACLAIVFFLLPLLIVYVWAVS